MMKDMKYEIRNMKNGKDMRSQDHILYSLFHIPRLKGATNG